MGNFAIFVHRCLIHRFGFEVKFRLLPNYGPSPDATNSMARTLVYYPSITIPTGQWLRRVLFYWDKVSSVVPQVYEDIIRHPYPPEVQYLMDEGIYHPLRPESVFIKSPTKLHEFEKELEDCISSDRFKEFVNSSKQKPGFVRIIGDQIFGKDQSVINPKVFDILGNAGLISSKPKTDIWIKIDKYAAMLYLSLLTKYIIELESDMYMGTNDKLYESIAFEATNIHKSAKGFSLHLINTLPFPKDNVPLKHILAFKRKRQDELRKFILEIANLKSQLSSCASDVEIPEILSKFQIELKISIEDLYKSLKDAKLATIAGSLEVLLKASSPAWLTPVLNATGIINIPMPLVLAGSGVSCIVSVAKYLIDKRNEQNKLLRETGISYLYYARQNKIL